MKENSPTYLSLVNQLDLSENDVLFIASDVKKMALFTRKENENFNANRFIESFQNVLTNGTILVPAYTDYLKNGDTFDWLNSLPSTGALSNKVMHRKDFKRSLDPLHSVFSWGGKSTEIAKIDSLSSLGDQSVFNWLYENDAKMICIDIDFQDSLTFVHFVEEKLRVKYRKSFFWEMNVINGKGVKNKKEVLFYTRKNGILTDLEDFQSSAIEKGVVTVIKNGDSVIYYFEIKKIHDFILSYIESGGELYRFSFVTFVKSTIKRILKK